MPYPVWLSRPKPSVLVVFLLCILLMSVFGAGCVRPDTGFTIRPESFESPPLVYAEEDTSNVLLPLNGTMMVSYPWTPEDGRYWRVSVTHGLFVAGDRYVPYERDVPVAVSGVRQWMVRAVAPGMHVFTGTLRPRTSSWNQETEQRTINVTVSEI